MTDLAIHLNKFSTAEIATVHIHLHQEVIHQVQVHPAVAAVPVHPEAVVEVVAVAQVAQAEVAIKS